LAAFGAADTSRLKNIGAVKYGPTPLGVAGSEPEPVSEPDPEPVPSPPCPGGFVVSPPVVSFESWSPPLDGSVAQATLNKTIVIAVTRMAADRCTML
jgi:hypothetical protein